MVVPAGGPQCPAVEVMIELLILPFETCCGENHSVTVTVQIDDVLLVTQFLGGVFEFFPAASIDGNADPAPGKKERSFVATALLMGARVPLFESYEVLLVTMIDGSIEFFRNWAI